jgi:hypothetical protein
VPYQNGRSQPAASKNIAPSSTCRSYAGERRIGRLDAHCSIGWTIPYVLLYPSVVRAAMCCAVLWWS